MPFVIGEVEVTNEVQLAPSAVLYDGCVVADGDLTIQVNNFYYDLGGVHGKYIGSVGNAVTDDSTNYVYLDSGASLVINTTGYPASAIHIRLARVVASGGFITRVILERALLTAAFSATGYVTSSRKVDTTNGLQGGGDLTIDRTLSPVYGSSVNTVCQGNDGRLSDDRTASGLRTATTVVAISAATAPTANQVLVATDGTIATWKTICAGSDGWIQFNDDGVFGAQSGFAYDKTSGTLTIGPATIYPNNPLDIAVNINTYGQIIFQNKNPGTAASTDICLTADNGDDTSFYLDLGIGSSNYAQPAYTLYGPNDGYLVSSDSNLLLGTYAEDTAVKFHIGGGLVENLVATIDATGMDLPSGLSYKVNGVVLPILTSTAPTDVTKDTAAVGTASEAARQDHKHDIATAATATGAVAVGNTAAEGSSTSLARADHLHAVARGTPVSVGTANSAGTGLDFAAGDHVHSGLTRGAGDFAVFTSKATPVSSDVLLIEDSAASGAKKQITIGSLPADGTAIHKAVSGEIAAMTEKTTPASADLLVIEDSAASNAKKKLQIGNLPADGTAIHKAVSGEISAMTEKTTPIAADLLVIEDSASSNAKRKLQIGNLPADGTAIHKAVSGEIAAMTEKLVPTGTDLLVIEDAAASNAKKKIQITNLPKAAPAAHASTHQNGGSDEVATATAAANAIPKAGSGGTLAIGWIPTGATSSTVCIGNDSRLSDDRTASGVRTATTVVSVSAATAPSTGQVLTATNGTTATWQTPVALTSSAPANVTKATAAVGVATDAARSDHKHDITTAAASSLTVGGSSAEGSATSLARSDHAHGLPAFGTGSGTFCQGNDSRLSDDRTASGLRTATTVVSVSAATAPSANQVLLASSSTAASWVSIMADTAPSNVTKAAASAGTASTLSRSDHKHDITTAAASSVGTANAEGSATSLARSDHVHSGLTRGAADYTAFTLKATPVSGDVVLIEDSAASYAKKYATVGTLPVSDSDAFHKSVAAEISALTEKTTPVDADWVLIEDSAASNAKKKVSLLNLPRGATLATSFCHRTTTAAITTSYSNITFDTTDVETDAAVVHHDGTNTERIQVLVAGTYQVAFTMVVTPSATVASTAHILKNGTTEVPGSVVSVQNYASEDNYLAGLCVVTLAANDYLAVQALVASGTGTVRTGATFNVTKMNGTTGATGSGSTITVQEDGSPVTGTPHSTLNFASGITASNSGGGVAAIALDTYPPIGDSSTKPSTPTSGTLLFAKNRAGRRMTAQIGPVGVDYTFQPSLFGNKIGWWTANGNGSTVSTINYGASNTGALTTRTVASTSFFTQIRRLGFVSATTAGSSAGTRHGIAQFWRGNASGLGGFFFVARFGISRTQTNYRWLVALSATTAVFSSAEPSTFVNFVGIGQDGTDTNIQFMYNDASGTATKVDLGASWPRPTANTQFYEFRLFIEPNGSTYYYSLENLSPSASAYTEGDTGGSTNIPSSTTFLSPQVWINNNAQLAAVGIDVSSIYIETDN